MTNTTERAELVALADRIDIHVKHGTSPILEPIDVQKVASALRHLASQDQKPPPAAGWDEAIEAAKKIANGYEDDVYEDEDMNAARRQVVKFIARDIEAIRTTPAATKSEPAPVAANASAERCKSSIVTCCVTGAIPGDGGACGDCDPCIMGEPLVPEAVKRIIAEKNRVIERNAELEEAANASAEARLREAYSALCEPRESQASDNLEGALYDIKRLRDVGKPTDDVCIRTIERVLKQLVRTEQALSAHPHDSDCDKQGCMGDQSPSDPKDLKELLSTTSVLEPSDRPADVTEEELATFIKQKMNADLFTHEARAVAKVVLSDFNVGRR